MGQSKIIGAIEIGTRKVVVLVGEIINGQSLNIIGIGENISKGVKKGEVFDFESASRATHSAILAAEKSSGVQLESVYLAQTGRHLKGFFDTGSINISASNHLVSKTDIARVVKEAKSRELSSDRVYIHHVQNAFKLDGRRVDSPYGMEGRKLEVGYWSVHGDVRKVRDQIHIANGYSLHVDDMIISSIASGCMVANDVEKKNGVLVIDIGCGTTDFLVYKDSFIVATGVLAVGGDHLTNDISLGLRTDYAEAENLKLNYGRAYVDETTAAEKIAIRGKEDLIQKEALYDILQARVGEIFSLIRKQLEPSIKLDELSGGAIITGGASQLAGMTKVAEEVLGLDVRLGQNPSWTNKNLKGPQYSTALGLLHYALSSYSGTKQVSQQPEGFVGKMTRFFKI